MDAQLVDIGGLGWPATAFLVAASIVADAVVVPPSQRLLVGVVAATTLVALQVGLSRRKQIITLTATGISASAEGREFSVDFAELVDITAEWGPYFGTLLTLTWQDGRVVEIPVDRSTKQFRVALGDALSTRHCSALRSAPSRALTALGLDLTGRANA